MAKERAAILCRDRTRHIALIDTLCDDEPLASLVGSACTVRGEWAPAHPVLGGNLHALFQMCALPQMG
jgi:hypothetical protein